MILALKTNEPDAEIGLYSSDGQKISHVTWQAHRQLAETIHKKIDNELNQHSKSLKDLSAVIFYEGPGSFTGLRIGAAVANGLAYSYGIPSIGSAGQNWVEEGFGKLDESKNETKSGSESKKYVIPKYGKEPNTTKPVK